MKIQLFSLVLAAALLNTASAVPMYTTRPSREGFESLARAVQQQALERQALERQALERRAMRQQPQASQQWSAPQQQRQPAFVAFDPEREAALREAREVRNRQFARQQQLAQEEIERKQQAMRRTNADINAGLADRQGRPQQGHGGPSSYRGNGDATVSMFKPHGTKQKQKSMITTRRVLTGTGIAAGIAAAAYPKKTMDYLDRFAKFTGLKEDKPTPKKVTVTPAKPAAAAAPAKPVAANTTAAAAPTNGTATAVPAAKTETVTVSLKPAPAASAAPVTASKPEEKKEEDKKAN